jgi:hypothetical protein
MLTYMYYRPTVFNIQPRGRSDRGMCDKVVMVTHFPVFLGVLDEFLLTSIVGLHVS